MPQTYTVNNAQYEYAPAWSLQDFAWQNNIELDTREAIDKAKELMGIIYLLWLDTQF